MRSAKRIEMSVSGLAPAGLYFQRVTQNLRGALDAPPPHRGGAAPRTRVKRTELAH